MRYAQRLSILRMRSLGWRATARTGEGIRRPADPTKTSDKQHKIRERAVASKNRYFSEITWNIDSTAVTKGVEEAFEMAKTHTIIQNVSKLSFSSDKRKDHFKEHFAALDTDRGNNVLCTNLT